MWRTNPSLPGCLTSARSGFVRQRKKATRVEQLDRTQGHGSRIRECELRDGSVSIRASLCFMRGKAHGALENWKSAELWCKEALTLDPYCFEAFDLLISSHLLSVGEEDRFLSSLQTRLEDKWHRPYTAQYVTADFSRLQRRFMCGFQPWTHEPGDQCSV